MKTIYAAIALLAAARAHAQVDVAVVLAQSEGYTMTIVSHEVRRLTKIWMTVYPLPVGTTSGATWDTWYWQAGPATSVSPPIGDDEDGQRTGEIILTTLAYQNQEILAVGDIDSPTGITQLKVKVMWENGVTGETWLAKQSGINSWEAVIDPFEQLAELPPELPAEQVYLSWVPPTTLEDGSPYTNPQGYKVYIGTTSHTYSTMLPSLGAANNFMFVQNLVVGLPYFFAVTAQAATGEESIFSNEATYTPVLATNDPVPPAGMKAQGVTTINMAYTINTVQNAMVLLNVGTVAEGTPCDVNQKINAWGDRPDDLADLYLIPLGTPGLELLPGVEPDVVYARCTQ